MNFDIHIDALVKKAFRTLGFVIRTARNFRSIDSILCLYFSLVRSQLEYGSVIWSPYYRTHVERLERIQKRFTRFIFRKFYIPYINYGERLRILGMKSLSQRRSEIDGVALYKLVNNLMNCDLRRDVAMRTNTHNVRNMALLGIRSYTINCAYHHFLPRTMKMFNAIFGQVNGFNLALSEFKTAWNAGLVNFALDPDNVYVNLVN